MSNFNISEPLLNELPSFSVLNGLADTVAHIDVAFIAIFGISVFFLVLNTVIMIYFCVRYSRKRNPVATNIPGHIGLELFWTIIPTIIVVSLFYVGLGFKRDSDVPKDALNVKVNGMMWKWNYEYPNGKFSETLVLPAGRAVNLHMTAPAADVLHAFYIPAFRIKMDVIPGRITNMWFTPNTPGKFVVFCAEYCGRLHSQMLSELEVKTPEDFKSWYGSDEVQKPKTGADAGLLLVQKNGCASCHSLDGTKLVGPTFKGIWERKVVVTAGGAEKEIVSDAAYLKKAIKEPNSDVVKDYPPAMPGNALKDEEIDSVIEYLKTIK